MKPFNAPQIFAPPAREGLGYYPVPYPQGTDRSGVRFYEFWLPDRFWLGALNGDPVVVAPLNDTFISGVRWRFADIPAIISGGLPSPYQWRLNRGRDKPTEHCVSTHDASAYLVADASTGSLFGAASRLRHAALCSTLVMFAPRVAGTVEVGGAYATLRPIYGPAGGTAIDYSDPLLPDSQFSVFEIGLATSGFTPQRQRIIAGQTATMRSGLGRADVYSPDGTKFAVTAFTPFRSVCSLAFDYVPSTADATIVATSQLVLAETTLEVFGLSRGFDRVYPAALWLKLPDHGSIGRIAFLGGAVAYPTWQGSALPDPDAFEELRWPRNAAWATWEAPLFPRTMRSAADGLRPEGKSLPSSGALAPPLMPIYSYGSYSSAGQTQVQVHPVRSLAAKCVELDTHPRFTEYDEKAAFLFDQRDDFVFSGKKITGLTVEFAPYLAAATEVPNGTFAQLTPPTNSPPVPAVPFILNAGQLASDTRFGTTYWQANGPVSVPAGADNYGVIFTPGTGASNEVTFFYSGTVSLFVDAVDGNALTTLRPQGSVDPAIEATALAALDRSALQVPFEPNIDPSSFYKSAPSSGAPPTGSYSLGSFSISGVASAPGVFRYVGAGDFSTSQTFTANRVVRWGGPVDWQFFGVVGGRSQYRVRSEAFRATIPTTVNVSLSTDHVELYAVLGSRLQESGTYVPPPQFEIGGAESFLEFQERSIAWSHDVWDQPKGKLRDQAVYIDGQEPHALLTLSLFGRTAMRSEATAEADYSSVPGFGGSFATGSSMQPYSSAVVGAGGTGFLSDATVLAEHHPYARTDYTFSRAQTLALLAGEAVDLTRWAEGSSDPVLMSFGVQFFHYTVRVTATVTNV